MKSSEQFRCLFIRLPFVYGFQAASSGVFSLACCYTASAVRAAVQSVESVEARTLRRCYLSERTARTLSNRDSLYPGKWLDAAGRSVPCAINAFIVAATSPDCRASLLVIPLVIAYRAYYAAQR